jgi:hypothetical protein
VVQIECPFSEIFEINCVWEFGILHIHNEELWSYGPSLNTKFMLAVLLHTYNLSYLGSRDQEEHGSKNLFVDSISTNKPDTKELLSNHHHVGSLGRRILICGQPKKKPL